MRLELFPRLAQVRDIHAVDGLPDQTGLANPTATSEPAPRAKLGGYVGSGTSEHAVELAELGLLAPSTVSPAILS